MAFLIKWGIIVAVALAALYACYAYLEKRCNTACREVVAAWDADKAMRIKRVTDITLDLSTKLQAALDAAMKLKGQVDDQNRKQAERVAAVPAGTRVTLPRPVARVLDHASDASNAARGTVNPGTEARTDPVPAAAATVIQDGVVYDGREYAQYLKDADAAYADAYQLWKESRAREDALRDAINKGLL